MHWTFFFVTKNASNLLLLSFGERNVNIIGGFFLL